MRRRQLESLTLGSMPTARRCRQAANGFLCGAVPLVSAVTDFVAIGVHANEQCENRCGFVATRFAAVIVECRENKLFSVEYCDYKKQFHFITNSQHTGFFWLSMVSITQYISNS